MYLEGRGKVYVATATNGIPGAFRYVADIEDLQLKPAVTTEDREENYSGLDLLALRITKAKRLDFQLTLREWDVENLALAFYGASASIASGSVTGEALPANLVAGDFVRLKYPQVSAVSLTGGAALVLGTDYEIESAAHGTIKMLTPQANATADYTYQGGSNLTIFTGATPERWIRFEGLNLADSDNPVLVELFRGQIEPVNQADLVSGNMANLQLSGTALYDKVNVNDSQLGPFGRIIHVAAAV